jgi:hypothetical protein
MNIKPRSTGYADWAIRFRQACAASPLFGKKTRRETMLRPLCLAVTTIVVIIRWRLHFRPPQKSFLDCAVSQWGGPNPSTQNSTEGPKDKHGGSTIPRILQRFGVSIKFDELVIFGRGQSDESSIKEDWKMKMGNKNQH